MTEETSEEKSDDSADAKDERTDKENEDEGEIKEGEIAPEIVAVQFAEEASAAYPVVFKYDSDRVTVSVNGEDVSGKNLAYTDGAYSFDAAVTDGYKITSVEAYSADPEEYDYPIASWDENKPENIEKRNNRFTISEDVLGDDFCEYAEGLFIVIETAEVYRVTFSVDKDVDMDVFKTLTYKIGEGNYVDLTDGESVVLPNAGIVVEAEEGEEITLTVELTSVAATKNAVYVYQDGENVEAETGGNTFAMTASKSTDIVISVRENDAEAVTVKESVLDATDVTDSTQPVEDSTAATIKYTKNCITKKTENGNTTNEVAKTSDLTFTVSPADGYDLKKVEYKVGSSEAQALTAADGEYNVPATAFAADEAAEVTIIATLEKKAYKVTFSLTGATAKYTSKIGGTTGAPTDVAADTEVVLHMGDEVSLTVTPGETGEGDSKVTNKLRYVSTVAEPEEDDILEAPYTIKADKDTPAETTVYVVATAPQDVNVKFTVGAGAEISELKTESGKKIKQAAGSSIAAKEDGTVEFIALAAEGSKVLSVKQLTGKDEDGEPVYETLTSVSGTYYETADGEAKTAVIYTLNLAGVTEDITIDVETDTTAYTAALKEMLGGSRAKNIAESIENDAVYTVDYDHVYKISLKEGRGAKALAQSDVTITGGTTTAVVVDGTLDIAVNKADAGKELAVTLKSGTDEVAAFKLQVLPPLEGVKIKNADGEEVTAITQTMDTVEKYEIVIPEGRTADDILPGVTSDSSVAAAAVKDGKLVVTANAAKDGTGTAKLTLQRSTVSASGGSYTAGSSAVAEITVTLAPPAWASATDGVVPTVKQTTSTDVSINLELAAAGVADPANGAVWYQVDVKPDVTYGDKKIADYAGLEDKTFYVKKTGDEQKVTLKVIDENPGEGYDWTFKVKATLLQTSTKSISILNGDTKNNIASSNYAVENATVCTGKASEDAEAKTLARALENKALKVKAGAKSIFTGQENVLIATAKFSSDDVTSRVLTAEDLTWNDSNVHFSYNDNGEVYMSVDAYAKNGNYWNNNIIGQHTIRISASYPEDDTYIEYAEVKVNVQRGIETINIQEASDIIYKADNKTGNLKTTTTLNTGNYTNNTRKPKSAKVSYDLIKADGSNEPFRSSAEITVSNKGVVSVKKNFVINPKEAENTFRVRVTAKDFDGNKTYAVTDPIAVTNKEQNAFGAVCIIDPNDSDYDDDGNEIYPVLAKTDSAKKPAEQKFTSDQLDGKKVVVVKKDVVVGASVKADDILEGDYFTYTSSNKKALGVSGSGYLNVLKAGVKNIKITVAANDGSKRSANIQKLAIDYVGADLGVKVQRLESGSYNSGTYVGAQTLAADKADYKFNDTTDTVFMITAVKANGDRINQFVDYKLSVSSAGKLDTATRYGNASAVTYVIANKEKATITLQYKANAGDKKYAKKTFTLTNEGWIKNGKQTLKVKTTDKLQANSVIAQHIKYTLTNAKDLKKALAIEEFGNQYYVMVNADKASRKKASSDYSRFINASNVEGWTNLENDGTFTLDFDANSRIPANKYKLQLTLGTIDINGSFVPVSKTVAVTLAATAAKTSYKPLTKVTLSVTDQTAVRLAGKASKFTPAYEVYPSIYNGVVNNQPNHFADYFDVNTQYDENTGSYYSALSLKSADELLTYAVEKYNADSNNTTKLTIATMTEADKNAMVADELAYITSADAKNDRWGYLDCYVQDTNGNTLYSSTYGNDKKVMMTVSLKSVAATVKAAGSYKAAPVTIAVGDKEAYVTVTGTLNKQAAGIAYAAVEANDCGFALDTSVDGYNPYNKVVYGNTVRLTLTNEQAAALQANKKGYKVNLKVVPEGSSIAARLDELCVNDLAGKTDKKDAREALINTYGVTVPATIKVVDLATATGKLSVKKDLSFWRYGFNSWNEGYDTYYDSAAGEYVIDVPCGLTMGTDATIKAAISPNKNNLAKTDDANAKLIGMSIETIGTAPNQYSVIRFTVGKEDLEKVDASKSGKWKKVKCGSKLSTKADVTFVQITTEKDEEGKNVEKETALKAETLTFNLTLPNASLKADKKFDIASPGSLVKDVTDAVSAGIGSEYRMNWPTRESFDGIYDENSDEYAGLADAFSSTYGDELAGYVQDVILAVRSEIEKNAPYDTGVDVIMTQLQDADGDWVWDTDHIKSEITAADFVLPATSTLGRDNGELTVTATLIDRASWDDTAKKYTKTADLEFNIRISATKEKAVDVQDALNNFVNSYSTFTCPDITESNPAGCGCDRNFAQHLVNAAKKEGNTTKEAIKGWIENYMYNEYLNATREAVGLSNTAATTLRLNYLDGVSVDVEDMVSIYGTINVWGVRYGDPDEYSGNMFAQKTISYNTKTSATEGTSFNEIVDAIDDAIAEIKADKQIKNAPEAEVKATVEAAVAECAKVSSEVSAEVTNLVRVAPATGKKGSVKFNVEVVSTNGEKSILSFNWAVDALRRETQVVAAIENVNATNLNAAVENAIAAGILGLTQEDYALTGEANAQTYEIKADKVTDIKAAAEEALVNAVKAVLGSDQANYDVEIAETAADGETPAKKHFDVTLFTDSTDGSLSYEVEVIKKGTTPATVATIKAGTYNNESAVKLTANPYVYTLAQAANDVENTLKAVDDWANGVDATAVAAKLPNFDSYSIVTAKVEIGAVSAATFAAKGSFTATVKLEKGYDDKDAAEPAVTELEVPLTLEIPVLSAEASTGSDTDAQTVATAIAGEVKRQLESTQSVTNADGADAAATAKKQKDLLGAAGVIVNGLTVEDAEASIAVKENIGLNITKATLNQDGSATITFTVSVTTESDNDAETKTADAACTFKIAKPVQDVDGFKAVVNDTIDALYGKEHKIAEVTNKTTIETEITGAINDLQGTTADATLTADFAVDWAEGGLTKSIRKSVVTYSGTLEIKKGTEVVGTIDVKLTVAETERSSDVKVDLNDCVVTVKNGNDAVVKELDLGTAPAETAKETLTVEVKTGESDNAAVVDEADYTVTGNELTAAGNQKVTVTAKNTKKYAGSKEVPFEVTVNGKYALSTLTWAVYKVEGENKTPISLTDNLYKVTTADATLTNAKAPSDIKIEVSHNSVVMKDTDASKFTGITWGNYAAKDGAEGVSTVKVTIEGYDAADKAELDFEITVTPES